MTRVSSSLLIRRQVVGAWPVAVLVALAVGLAGFSAADAAGTVTNCASYGSTGTVGDLAWALQEGGGVDFACNGTIVVPEIAITLDTTIDATGNAVALTGNAANRVFFVSGGARLELIAITVTAGSAEDTYGGGIYADSFSTVTLANSIVIGNTAVLGGGGVYAGPSSIVALTNSTVSGNAAAGVGGGIYAGNPSTVTLMNSTVSGNTAPSGGGIYAGSSSTVTLTNSAVSANVAVGTGGGIQAFQATVGLTQSAVSGNTAGGAGGGLSATRSTTTLTNSTVSGNTAGGAGGGLLGTAADLVTLTNSTVSLNGAATDGGGIYACFNCTVSLLSSLIAGNTAGGSGPDCAGAPSTSLGYNLIGNDSGCSFAPTTGDLVNVDPLLGPLQGNGGPTFTHALLAGSPAIDAGSPDCPPPDTDQRGVPRPQGAACDIGAYEFVSSADTVTIRWAIFVRIASWLFVSATSSASPNAALFLTVGGCLTEAPMPWNGKVYAFRQNVKGCGNLDGQTATVTSSHGGVATATIQ